MLNGGEGINRLAGGVCLILAPVVLLAGAIVHPSTHDDGAGHLAVVRDDPDRYFAAHAILLFGLALFLVAVLALFHIVRGRQALLGHLGGGLAIVGIVGSAAVVGTDGIVISQMGEPERNADEVAALLDAIKDSTRLRAIGGISGISFLLGMLSLAYGMWRSRAVSYWLAGGVAVDGARSR